MVTLPEPPPLVSVVIPCFNYGRFLGEAIESVRRQTYRPIEIIVVDDGSTDETAEVARRYPVKLIVQQNAGLAAAANAGIRASTGAYVMRLDADDRLKPTYVEETAKVLVRDSALHFVYTEVEYFGARTGTYSVTDFDPDSLAERNYVHASALMRRSSFDVVGGYCDGLRALRCEDWDLWLSFVDHGMRGKLVPQRLLEYRRHPRGSMANFNLVSMRGAHRELLLVSHLQDHHPDRFAIDLLIRRLTSVPKRVAARQVSLRFATMLVAFYAVMLVRSALRIREPRRVAGGVSQ
jgi:glycosyltransferase involved in cell wall biosynthesis